MNEPMEAALKDTKTLRVVEYLRNGGTLESLDREHMVRARPYRGKISFSYRKIGARDDDPIAQQCRGLILREGSLEVVAYPFDRFFNLGQGAAAPIDWDTACFEEKLDGTLLIVYWDENVWRCGTRQMCEAHGDVNGAGTFAQMADASVREMGVGARTIHELMEGVGADRGVTHMFELTGPYNRVVCEYEELGMTLLGARRLSDFAELNAAKVAADLGFRSPKTWAFSSMADMTEVIREWSPTKYEGVVVKDASFNRVKVKSPQYLAVHHAVDSLGASWRAVCEAILTGHADDIMAKVPKFVRARVEGLRAPIAQLMARIESDYQEIRHIDDMKAFAFAARERLMPGALFALKRGKADSAEAFLRNVNADTVLEACRQLGWDDKSFADVVFEAESNPVSE